MHITVYDSTVKFVQTGRHQSATLHVEEFAARRADQQVVLCSHRKKRMRQIKKMMQRGLMDPEQEDPFTLFVASTNIRYCFYAETQKILGNTYGMCVLQVKNALLTECSM